MKSKGFSMGSCSNCGSFALKIRQRKEHGEYNQIEYIDYIECKFCENKEDCDDFEIRIKKLYRKQ